MCLRSSTPTYPQLCNVLCLAVKLILDVSHQLQCVTLVLNHLLQTFLVASPWESAEQWCQLHGGKPTGSDKVTAGCQTHCLLLGTILEMLNCLTCHIAHDADSAMTFPLMTAFAVCFEVDKSAVLHESYIGCVTKMPGPFPLHRVYWTRTLIVWILPSAKQRVFMPPGHVGRGGALLCQGTRLEVMARQLSPGLMKVCLIAWSAAKLLPAWSKSKAWNGHISLKEAHLQAEGCRGGRKKTPVLPAYVSHFPPLSVFPSMRNLKLATISGNGTPHFTQSPESGWNTTVCLGLPILTMQIGCFLLLWVASCSVCPRRES